MVTLSQALLIALDHHQAGRMLEAEDIYRQILGADPEHADAMQLLGVLTAQTGRQAEACRCLRLAVTLRPDGAGGLSNLAGVEQSAGALDGAVRHYGWALRLMPDLADAHASRAGALRRLGRVPAALAAAGHALALAPDHADALANRAAALLSFGDARAAERCARRSLSLNGRSAVALASLAAALAAQRRWAEAEAAARGSLALDREAVEPWEVLGAVLAKLARFSDSLEAFSTAERLRSGPSVRAARGIALIAMARPVEAAVEFEHALADRPDDVGLHWNLGFARLMAGDYERGWPEFDWRRRDNHAEPPWRPFPQPLWQGEPLNGRTILLYAEQGLGDTLQFLRYVPLVAARGGRVVLEVQRPLLPLTTGLEGAAQVIARGDPLPTFDLECPLMSLPRAFATGLDSVPADIPYLRPDPARADRWRERLGPRRNALCVGIVWAGNPRFPGDEERSPGLAGLRGVFDVPGCRFYGLQMGPGRARLADNTLPDSFTDLGTAISDFADTAAIMANLDLVVSSCTGPAHLAGALGVPLWVALPFSADWRWLTGRDDSPWYPTARLFRQSAPGDWPAVAGRMATELAALAQRFRPLP